MFEKLYTNTASTSDTGTASVQGSITSFVTSKPLKKWSPTDPKQRDITIAIVTFIAVDLLPLSTVESQAFRNVKQNHTM